jgi:spermidine/putrescine transport system ATP-binding protein
MSPRNLFVAKFIGESNFLEGYAADSQNKETLIELRDGIRVQAVNNEVKKGERVVLAIRPEAFSVEEGKRKGPNSMTGTVERVTFEGTNIRYDIMLANEDRIVIVKPSMIGRWLRVDEEVTLSFSPEKAHIFAYPEVGLKEELAVE